MTLLNAKQVSDILNTSTYRVYELSRLGILPTVHLGRQVRFCEDTLIDWIRQGGQALPGGWKREAE